MQWLIDLVIEAIGIPPTYIDRGDPAVVDFVKGDLTTDGTWHDIDLSAIVPAGATAVAISIIVNGAVVSASARFRKNGNVNRANAAIIYTTTANQQYGADLVVHVDADRICEYIFANIVWNLIEITVKGWWL